MKRIIISALIYSLLISSCSDTLPSNELPADTNTPTLLTATPQPPQTQSFESITPTTIPTLSPIVDSEGSITWHPQQALVLYEDGGGDGVYYDYPPNFLLLWDGTLFQPNYPEIFISHLDNQEVCKLLNTVDASGFFKEPNFYNFPFDGLGSSYISVNSWDSHSSGSQILSYAISGAPFYDGLFCRDCPIPSEDTIIQPGLANIYFLLENYYSPNRQSVQSDTVRVYIDYTEEPSTHSWPFKTISISDFFQKCNKELYCLDIGMQFDGNIAKEMLKKGDSSQLFKYPDKDGSFRLRYRPVWPYEPSYMYGNSKESVWKEMPSDYTLTCDPSMGQYPILPLNSQSEFWYYSPNGKWGAELVKTDEQDKQIRVVSTFGYEKYYKYNPALFNQTTIEVYPRYWTKDGKYFFINILPSDYNRQKTPFINSLGLQRITMEDGKVDYIFIGTKGQRFAYGINEEFEQAAYIRQDESPLKITIKDIHSLQEKTATLLPINNSTKYTEAGTIIWSLDGKSLFVAANYVENSNINSVIIKVDTYNPAIQSIIYQKEEAFKLILASSHDYKAEICPLTADYDAFCSTRVDLETGEIIY